MSYFPTSILPKQLVKETCEVPGLPDIFNGADYNSHEREIIAIERFLLGAGWSSFQAWSGFSGSFSGYSPSSNSTELPVDPLTALSDSLNDLTTANQVMNFTGIMANGTAMPVWAGITYTETNGTTLVGDTSIVVSDATNFAPNGGLITKFNSLPSFPSTLSLDAVQVYNMGGQMTFQEVIQYSYTTPTSFEGCTRGMFGTTVQESSSGNLIIAGEASIMFTPLFWGTQNWLAPMDSMLIEQTNALAANLRVFASNPTGLDEKTLVSRLGYSLIVKNQVVPSGGS